jgi:hypothetical protein
MRGWTDCSTSAVALIPTFSRQAEAGSCAACQVSLSFCLLFRYREGAGVRSWGHGGLPPINLKSGPAGNGKPSESSKGPPEGGDLLAPGRELGSNQLRSRDLLP